MVTLKNNIAVSTLKWRLYISSGLEPSSMETKVFPDRPDRIYIVYRHPVTKKVMKTPDGRPFKRYRQYGSKNKPKYHTCKGGGVHLYFPTRVGIYNVDIFCKYPNESIYERMNVIEFLRKYPDEPVYITEGEKKAAKAWQEGLACVAIPGIWCWNANKEDRPNGEKILHPDFDLIPGLNQRAVIMIYDSDANNPEKKAEFDKCSEAFEKCLRARGVSRYEKIVLPSDGNSKVGLDDYLMTHSVAGFERLVAEQSKTLSLKQYIMPSHKFLSTNFPPIRFILQPWLTDCGLTMIHSAPGVGKTFFLLGVSVAITRKYLTEDFCGWKIKNGAGVLFIDGEMPAKIMQERLAKVEAAYPNNPTSKKNKLWLLSCQYISRQTGKNINFSNENSRNMFSKILATHPAKIIIFDNIVSLMNTKDENDSGAWSEINQWLLYLRSMGKSVIIVHHSSKHNTQRGTSHRSDNLDTILQLKSGDKDNFIVRFEKHRNFGGDEASPIPIDFQVDKNKAVFTRQEDDDLELENRNQEIWDMDKARTPRKEIAKHFGISKGRISQILKEMEEAEKEEDK